ncbi:LysO family transporter [Alkaliphilus transvaalensis]|uniref:LysO family transporter n=1 Tax=Alkaliphilus transvaalensis TaxID=114628 RepID=UPI00047D38FF|nr:LysO family transporter [Alkaliphilus transvaalensis]
MDILLYLGILLVGAFIGFKDNKKLPLLKYTGEIQTFALLFLLFVMGIKIGLDREIIYSFRIIGLQGTVLALASIIFSILGVRFISGRILHQKGRARDDI